MGRSRFNITTRMMTTQTGQQQEKEQEPFIIPIELISDTM